MCCIRNSLYTESLKNEFVSFEEVVWLNINFKRESAHMNFWFRFRLNLSAMYSQFLLERRSAHNLLCFQNSVEKEGFFKRKSARVPIIAKSL